MAVLLHIGMLQLERLKIDMLHGELSAAPRG
jgi:hypothetical protein